MKGFKRLFAGLFFFLISPGFIYSQSKKIVVSKDGTGDFSTVQQAINAVQDSNNSITTIYIRNGIYKEKLVLPEAKINVHFVGESVEKTILTYDDYASRKDSAGKDIGTSGSASFFIYASDFSAEYITFENSSGPVGQAVAVRVTGDRARFINCRFLGFQDTLYTHGNESRQYYLNCYIEGTVDFIFGASTCLFDSCTIYGKRAGFFTAASTPENKRFGYVFLHCKITGDAPPGSFFLGRPWRPFAKVAFIDCDMDNIVKPEGWNNWGKESNEKTAFYAEFNNHGDGSATAGRAAWSHTLNAAEATQYISGNILSGWKPLAVKAVTARQGFNIENVSGFYDSKHHWLDITDKDKVITPLKDQKFYQPANFREIADNILLYQQPNGGWAKNYDMLAILTEDQKESLAEHKDAGHTTFDNGATYTHTEYLAKAYSLTGEKKYMDAALRGIQFILKAQYDNGGWPQFYPDVSGYRKYITFNDGGMIGIMTVLQHIVEGEPYYSFLGRDTKEKVAKAYRKGLTCILKCQIKENGKLTVWCQQHDNITLKPANARTFELASKSGQESAEIVAFLMQVDNPGTEIINSINSAVAWFKKVQINGIRVKTIAADSAVYQFHASNNDRVVVKDPAAPPIWTRFYELGTDRPLFANRDGKVVYQLSDVARERRTGYSWYGYRPAIIINQEYPKWLEKIRSHN